MRLTQKIIREKSKNLTGATKLPVQGPAERLHKPGEKKYQKQRRILVSRRHSVGQGHQGEGE